MQARYAPQREAVRRGNDSLSYDELERRSDRIAQSLIRHGVRPGEPVGVLAGRSVAMVSALLGVLKSGAHYVPIDPALPSARKKFIADDTALKIALCENTEGARDWGERVQAFTVSHFEQASNTAVDFPEISPETLAYVMYTSGSTGTPKGVLITHGSVLNLAKDPDYVPLEQNDRLLLTGAIGFDQTTFEIWGALLNGLTLFLPEDDNALLDAHTFGAMLSRHGITTVLMTTTMCVRLITQDAAVFRALKYLLIGGDILLPETCHLIHSFCPGIRIINGYGPTESTTFATTFTVGPECMLSVPIGKPLRNVTAHLIDDAGEIIHDDRPGELLIGGANLARGYFNRPELNNERFTDHPLLGRLYRSGDLVRRRADGNLEFLGRKDRQVKVGGYRIELNEVEAAIAAAPGVLGCVVRTWEHKGEKFIAAYYVGHDAPEPAVLRQRMQKTLPAYMVPAFFYHLEALPLDAHGKTDQKSLADPFATSTSPTPPALRFYDREELLERIREAWQKTLGLNHVGASQDFYDLGGSSIKAVHLMGILMEQGMDLALADIMHHRTVAAMTDYIHAQHDDRSLLRDEQEVLENLRAISPHGSFRFCKLQTPGREKPLVVLHCEGPVAAEELLARLSKIAAPEWWPHHVVGTEPECDEERLAERLGLRDAAQIDLEPLRHQIRGGIRRNDDHLKSGPLARIYPFSPMQELQFSVTTPPSRGAFRVDAHLDLHLLRRAYAQLLEEQGLLRSIPVESGQRWQWQQHQLRSDGALEPTFIDLSEFWISDEDISRLLWSLADGIRFQGDGLQYHVVVVRRNRREHILVLVFHHILFDRVSMEVIRRELMSHYRELASGEAAVRRATATFEEYVRHIYEGPRGVTQRELVERFHLEEFHAAKRDLLASARMKTIDRSYQFEIAASAPGHLARGHSLGTALALYTRAVRAVFGVRRAPILFVHDGRRYGGRGYYDVVGEHIDFVPLLVDAEDTPTAIQRHVDERLAILARHSVNFMYLVLRPVEGWEDVARLVDIGPDNARLDVCMFNYMGNQPRPGSSAAEASQAVELTANPLPFYTFLNCIAVSFTDGFVFRFRSTYEPYVEELRTAFAQLSPAMAEAAPV
jgi:amino acid adenylation domain-containing protein